MAKKSNWYDKIINYKEPDYSKLIYTTKKGGRIMHIGSMKKGDEWWATIKNLDTHEIIEVKMQIFINSIKED